MPRTRSPAPAETPETRRAARAGERRAAIAAAALAEFTRCGFAAARMDDIAARAGVAKGTIYLHFADKEALFQELVRSELGPIITRIGAPPSDDVPTRALVERIAGLFLAEVVGTHRGDILRLLIAEGPRFPALAEFYYREVVERGLGMLRALIARGMARGEIRHPGLAAAPQLLVAPALVAVLWQALFARFSPLDAQAMLQTHLDLIFGPGRAP
jgi:AcrR family transcriptional regulator